MSNYVEWPSDVNSNFYSGVNGYKDNSKTTEYASGRKISFLANEKFLKTKEVKLHLDDTGDASEYKLFNIWLTDSLGGLTGVFHCAALDTSTETLYWRLQDLPTETSGQRYKDITLKIEQEYI